MARETLVTHEDGITTAQEHVSGEGVEEDGEPEVVTELFGKPASELLEGWYDTDTGEFLREL